MRTGPRYTAAPLHGARGPLTRIRPRRGQSAPAHPHYRLADYLEQHGRTDRDTSRAPAVLWEAFIEHHASRDCRTPARAARDRGLLRIAMRFYAIAAHTSDNDALKEAAWLLVRAGRTQEAI